MLTQKKLSTVQASSAPTAAYTAGVLSVQVLRMLINAWQQIRRTLRGRFILFAICLILLSLALAFFFASSFQQASSDLDTINNGSIPSIDASQSITQYIEDIDAKSADYLATAALTTTEPCQIVGPYVKLGPLTVHDCDDRNIDAEIIAANHQVFLAAHNVTYPGERTAVERTIAGFQDYIAQIGIMRYEYGLAASKADVHDPHLQNARRAYSAANTILTTRIISRSVTDATRETGLPNCAIAGHIVAPDSWVPGGIRTNVDCLSSINYSHLTSAYNDVSSSLSSIVIRSILLCFILCLFVAGTTWYMTSLTHRIINIGLTLALLVSIIFSIAAVARLVQASGQHGDFGQMVQDDYKSIYDAALLKRYGTDANADESRWLIALEFGDKAEAAHWQQDWQANTTQVKQLMSNAKANRTWIEEDQPLTDIQSNWDTYFQIDGNIRSSANAGQILAAERLSTGNSNVAFSKFSDAVDRLSQANRDHYNSTLNDTQGALTLYIYLSAILFPLIGLSAAWGISQRLKDF